MLFVAVGFSLSCSAFEGRIEVTLTFAKETMALRYTIGQRHLRVEVTGSTAPNPVNILDLKSGEMTLLFPNNRSFVRLKPAGQESAMPGVQGMPMPPGGLPPGIGPQSNSPIGTPSMPAMPPGIDPQPSNALGLLGGVPGLPTVPAMAAGMLILERPELKATGKKENIHGYASQHYEIKERGATLEIWATNRLIPCEAYLRNQPHRVGPQMIEEQWPKLLKDAKLFPLRAILRYDNGVERFRWEVKSIREEALQKEDAKLFEPPSNYFEIEPLPF